MISAVFLLAFIVLAVLQHRANQAALAAERARVDELLGLLEAKAAPAQYYARPMFDEPEQPSRWVTSPDGLISHPVYD